MLKLSISIATLLCSFGCLAQQKNSWVLETALGYANVSSKKYDGALSSTTDTQAISESVGLRYMFKPTTSAFMRVSRMNVNQNISGQNYSYKESTKEPAAWNVFAGGSHEFKDDSSGVGIVGMADVALKEEFSNPSLLDATSIYDSRSFKSFNLGTVFYKSYDPVLISCAMNFNYNTVYKDIKPGNSFSINPKITFAINEKVSLDYGYQLVFQKPIAIAGETTTYGYTLNNAILGAVFKLDQNDSIATSFKHNISHNQGSYISVGYSHGF